MTQEFTVVTQGLTSTPLSANGSYDVLDWGEMSAEELMNFFQEILTVEELDYSTDEDLCQPNVMVDNPGKGLTSDNVSFYLDDGQLFLFDSINDINVSVSAFEAVSLCSGHMSSKDLESEEEPPADSNATPMGQPVPPQPPPFAQPMQQPPVNAKPGCAKVSARVIGIFILVIGALAMLGGEPGGGLMFMFIGIIPAAWGFTKSKYTRTDADMAANDAAMTGMMHNHMSNYDDDYNDSSDYDGGGDFE